MRDGRAKPLNNKTSPYKLHAQQDAGTTALHGSSAYSATNSMSAYDRLEAGVQKEESMPAYKNRGRRLPVGIVQPIIPSQRAAERLSFCGCTA